jgi:gluconokinase
MNYTLEVNVTAMMITTALRDENGKATRSEHAYPNMVMPSDDITAETIFDTAVTAYRDRLIELREEDRLVDATLSFIANAWVALDENGQSLTPIMNGAKQHGAKYVDALMINGIGGQLQRKSGVPLTETTPLVMTIWLKDEHPEAFAKTARLMGVAEYFRFRLTERPLISEANAAKTGFYNLSTQTWDKQALALTGITDEQLPTIVSDEEAAKGDVLANLVVEYR